MKERNFKNNYSSFKTYIITFLCIVLIFQDYFQSIAPFFSYMDEILSIVIVVLYVLMLFTSKRVSSSDLIIITSILFLVIFSIIGNINSLIQLSFMPISVDILTIFKFFFIYMYMKKNKHFFLKNVDIKQIVSMLSFIMKIYILILMVLGITNLFINIDMHYEVRYGIRAFSFIYDAPGVVINQITYFLIILSAENYYKKSKNNFFIVLAIFLVLFTLRTRGIILTVIFIVLRYFIIYKKKITVGKKIPFLISGIILIGYPSFKNYFLSGDTPRLRFIEGASYLMKEYLPFGSGFATFGSAAAADNYSPLYYELGFNKYYGMSENEPLFLHDNYWPMIFGQLGIIGGIVFFFLFIFFIIDFYSYFKKKGNYEIQATSLFYLFNIVFSSIQSSYPAHYSMVTLTFLMMLLFPKKE